MQGFLQQKKFKYYVMHYTLTKTATHTDIILKDFKQKVKEYFHGLQ